MSFSRAVLQRAAPSAPAAPPHTRVEDVVGIVTGAFLACQIFGTRMLAAGRGCIVNVASITGAEMGTPGRAAYAASGEGVRFNV